MLKQKEKSLKEQAPAGEKKRKPNIAYGLKMAVIIFMLLLIPLLSLAAQIGTVYKFGLYGGYVADYSRLHGTTLIFCILLLVGSIVYTVISYSKIKKDPLVDGIGKTLGQNSEDREKRKKAMLKVFKGGCVITIVIQELILMLVVILGSPLLVMETYNDHSDIDIEHITIHEAGHALLTELSYPGHEVEIRMFFKEDFMIVNQTFFMQNALPRGINKSSRSETRYLEDAQKKIRILLGGYAAELLLTEEKRSQFGSNSDIEKVGEVVKTITDAGLSSEGPIPWELLSPQAKYQVYNEIVDPQLEETKKLILENEDRIRRLAKALAEKNSLKGDEIRSILALPESSEE